MKSFRANIGNISLSARCSTLLVIIFLPALLFSKCSKRDIISNNKSLTDSVSLEEGDDKGSYEISTQIVLSDDGEVYATTTNTNNISRKERVSGVICFGKVDPTRIEKTDKKTLAEPFFTVSFFGENPSSWSLERGYIILKNSANDSEYKVQIPKLE